MRTVKTLIIGGGIIGLAIGYYLSKRNFGSVKIIERDPELMLHASGHNAGGLAGVHESHRREMRPLFRESSELYRELGRSLDFDYATGGTLSPGSDEDSKVFQKIASEANNEFRANVEFLDSADLKQREPNLSTRRFNCALYYPDDAQGNSKKLGHRFAMICQEKGIEIETESEVMSFDLDRGRVAEVRTSRGSIIPDNVIEAAGPWSVSFPLC